MEILGLNPIQTVLLIGLVSGGTELVKRLFAKDWKAAAIIAVAAVIGGLGSLLVHTEVVIGVVAGLAASGYITIVQNFGKASRQGERGPAGPQGPMGPKGDRGESVK